MLSLEKIITRSRLRKHAEEVRKLKQKIAPYHSIASSYALSFYHVIEPMEKLHMLLDGLMSELSELEEITSSGAEEELSETLAILNQPVITRNLLDKDIKADAFSLYLDLFNSMASYFEGDKREIISTPYQDMIAEVVISRDCPFKAECASRDYDEIGGSVKQEFQMFASGMRGLLDLDVHSVMLSYQDLLRGIAADIPGLFVSETGRHIPGIDDFIPEKNGNPEREEADARASELKRALLSMDDWSYADKVVASFLRGISDISDTGILSLEVIAMPSQPPGVFLRSIRPQSEPITLADLIGYDEQKARIIKNTELLLSGKDAHHTFIYGESGTGKSAIINALLQEYKEHGLRVINIAKPAIEFVPHVFPMFEEKDEKYIVLVDEFELDRDIYNVGVNKDHFKALNALIEGSFSAFPKNARLYLISNSKNNILLNYEQSEGSERMSLLNRFGLLVEYDLPKKEEEIEILKSYLLRFGIIDPLAEDIEKRMSFETARYRKHFKDRNMDRVDPRSIKNYVVSLQDVA